MKLMKFNKKSTDWIPFFSMNLKPRTNSKKMLNQKQKQPE
jgi:hypothetical protein